MIDLDATFGRPKAPPRQHLDEAVGPALAALEWFGWAEDAALRQQQWAAADRIDAAYDAGDAGRLHQAVATFVNLMGGGPSA